MSRIIPPRTWVPVDVWLSSQHRLQRAEFTEPATQPATPQQVDHRAAISRAITRAGQR